MALSLNDIRGPFEAHGTLAETAGATDELIAAAFLRIRRGVAHSEAGCDNPANKEPIESGALGAELNQSAGALQSAGDSTS